MLGDIGKIGARIDVLDIDLLASQTLYIPNLDLIHALRDPSNAESSSQTLLVFPPVELVVIQVQDLILCQAQDLEVIPHDEKELIIERGQKTQ